MYSELFSKGQLSEQAYRDLYHSLGIQEEALRTGHPLPAYTIHPPKGRRLRRTFFRLLGNLAESLISHTMSVGETIIEQGESGNSLFLIACGVIRVSRTVGSSEHDLATLMAGDFFGEIALLHGEPRNATCRAVTPAALYELDRYNFDQVRQAYPAIQEALEEADRRRR